MSSFVVTVDAADAELAADRLWQLGVRAVEERRGEDDRVELWTVVGEAAGAVAAAAAALDDRWRWRIEDVAADWPETWRDHARPIEVGADLVVVPAWNAQEAAPDGRIAIVIEPGAAFGLGDHPTTALTLAALERELGGGAGRRVLDVGCGTGVLSIGAALLGAGPIRAVDVSAAAIDATNLNAELNDVAGLIEVDSAAAGELLGEYDLVVANILAPALIAMADDLRRLTSPAGRLIVSGVLAGAHDHVLDAFASMRVVRTDAADGWAAVTMAHR